MPVSGHTDSRFGAVRDVFEASFDSGENLGAVCAVTVDGALVVDLVGGFQDRKKETPWQEDTIVGIYSSGKAVLALMVATAVEQGLLDYDQYVAQYWPEFADEGKDRITLAEAMSHQGGLCGFPDEMPPETWLDWNTICDRLAAMTPLWLPGTASGYHPQTFGFIVGEVLRRVTGKSVGQLMRENLSGLQYMRVFCGLKPDELAHVSNMTKPARAPDLGELNEFTRAAFLTRWASPAGVSREDWAMAEIPASNMFADARSLARLMSVIACDGSLDGRQILSRPTLEAMTRERCRGDDLVLPFNLSWAAGLMRNSNLVYGPEETALGHSGFGGSCVVADPVNRVSFAFVLNKMSHHLVGDPRAMLLIDTVYKSL